MPRIRIKHRALAGRLARKRFSRNAWARRLGLSSGHLSNLCNGRRPYPSRKTRQKLLKGLDLPFEELFEVEQIETTQWRPGRIPWLETRWKEIIVPVFRLKPGVFRARSVTVRKKKGKKGMTALFEQWPRDARYAIRTLRASPGFTIVAVVSLALSIGTSTTIFSVVNALMLRSLPLESPHELVSVSRLSPVEVAHDFPYQIFDHLRGGNRTLDSLFARFRMKMRLESEGRVETVTGVLVSGDYQTGLGFRMARGRPLLTTDDEATGPANGSVAVISHRFWDSRFGQSPDAIGRRIRLNGLAVEIVGITQPGFTGVEVGTPADLWVPLSLEPQLAENRSWLTNPRAWWLEVMGRLRPGVGRLAAQSELTALYQGFRLTSSGDSLTQELREEIRQETILLRNFARGISSHREPLRTPLTLLSAAAGLLLLIACANIANLLIARANARSREIAVRAALGAGRLRLARQMLTESLLLGLLGIGPAVLLALWWNEFLRKTLIAGSIDLDIRLSPQVLLFAALLSFLATLLFGSLPAGYSVRQSVVSGLKSGDSGLGSRLVVARLLVISQVAMSVALVLISGLLMRSIYTLANQDPGFNPDNLLLFRMDPRIAGYKESRHRVFMRETVDRLAALPSVKSVSYSLFTPLTPAIWKTGGFRIEGRPVREDDPDGLETRYVGPNFFETMAMPLLAGRTITSQDNEGTYRVGVVNQAVVQRFKLAQPLGAILTAPPFEDRYEIVGVVGNAKYRSMRDDKVLMLYLPFHHMPRNFWGPLTVELRTSVEPTKLVAPIRDLIPAEVPVGRFNSMRGHIAESLRNERIIAALTSAFGLLALFLASVGLGGVVNYIAKRKTREIGVRMALGAKRSDIVTLVLREVFLLVTTGGAVGLASAIGAAHLLSSLLFGVTSTDPVALALTVGAAAAVALAAAYLPTRRAAAIDPIRVLRHE